MLSNYNNSKKLWDDLNERLCLVNGPPHQQIKSDINHCEQTKTMLVVVNCTKLSILWSEMDKYEPLINCKCDPLRSLNRTFHTVLQKERVRGNSHIMEESPSSPTLGREWWVKRPLVVGVTKYVPTSRRRDMRSVAAMIFMGILIMSLMVAKEESFR
ncbi:DIS3-like exonuclease 1 [Bienertia sinuspersici]